MNNKTNKLNSSDSIIDAINLRTLSHHPTALVEVLTDYGLIKYYNWFIQYNTIEQKNIYHNNQHTQSVVLNAFEGAVLHCLSVKETTLLLLAALFHDFRHTQGQHSDRVNIDNAIRGYRAAVDELNKSGPFTKDDIESVVILIKVTSYPYPVKKIYNQQEKIIIDADNMVMYEPADKATNQLVGLFNEQDISMGVNTFYNKQNIHYSSQIWRSHWGYVKANLLNYPEKSKIVLKNLNQCLSSF